VSNKKNKFALMVYGDILNPREVTTMTKSEVVSKIVASVEKHIFSIDKTVNTKIALNNASYALTEKIHTIYNSRDVKELGSNSETRNAKIAVETVEESKAVLALENALEIARAEEIKAKAYVDQMRYIVRILEANIEE
jgi:hypothetical protein